MKLLTLQIFCILHLLMFSHDYGQLVISTAVPSLANGYSLTILTDPINGKAPAHYFPNILHSKTYVHSLINLKNQNYTLFSPQLPDPYPKLYKILLSSDVIIIPISYYDIINGEWLETIPYRTLLSFLHLTKTSHTPHIMILIDEYPGTMDNEANKEKEIIERTLLRSLELSLGRKLTMTKQFQVVYNKTGDEIIKSFPYEIPRIPANLSINDHIKQIDISLTLDKNIPISPTSLANDFTNQLTRYQQTARSIFNSYKTLLSNFPDEFHFGYDPSFGPTCDEIIQNIFDTFDEEASNLNSSLLHTEYKTWLKQWILSDLLPKYETQLNSLKQAIQTYFRKRLDTLTFDEKLPKELSKLINECDKAFTNGARKLKAKLSENWTSENLQDDLRFSLRETSSNILEFARLNGIYSPGKMSRKPISLSLHYLSPSAFGLSNLGKMISLDPEKIKYNQNPNVLITSGDPRTQTSSELSELIESGNFQNNFNKWSNSLIYKPSSKN